LLNYPEIYLEINSVFTPETVDYLSESIQFIMDLGVSNINISFSILKAWNKASLLTLEDEMTKLRKIVLVHYKRNGDIPLINFREKQRKGFFYCAAGQDRLAITPEEAIWGCFPFPDYFKGKEKQPDYQKFYFGTLDNFIKNHNKIYPQVASNYSQLSMDNFSTPNMSCFLCPNLENCALCPVNASFSGLPLGKIPSFACEIQKIKIKEKEKFRFDLLSFF